MLGLEEAGERILAGLRPSGTEDTSLDDAAGRVLAADIASSLALPPWDNSAMDGYAVRASDVAGASPARPVELRVVDDVAAGGFPSRAVGQGEAARVMTGAPIPEGADSVVRVEDTDGGTRTVLVRDGRDAGRNVRARGEDVAEGALVLRAGAPIGPAAVAMLAALGCERVTVARRPRVAIFGSGDELVPVARFAEVRAGRRIVASNGYAIAAVARSAGGVVTDLGTAPDDRAAIRARFEEAARHADLIVTSAGVSVGEHDHVRSIVGEIGAVEQWRIAARPGSQIAFGRVHDVPWLGLPGNPVSAVITAELFVRAAVLRMQGVRAVYPAPLEVSVETAVPLAGTTQLLRATIARRGARLVATLTGAQGSGRLSSIAAADVLLVIGPGDGTLAAGAPVAALPLRGAAAMVDRLVDGAR